MGDDPKVCLICGIDSNKKAKHDRYNLPPIRMKKGKPQQQKGSSDSESDSEESSSKGGRRAPSRAAAKPAAASRGSSRQTRNQNPKTFAASLCKVMHLPATPDHPFLEYFSSADYCPDCMTRVKDVHTTQGEFEKLQERLNEARVDIELDMSKHLQKIPFCTNVLRNTAFQRYKEAITQILDYHDPEKKGKLATAEEEEEPVVDKKSKKLKRKSDANGKGDTEKAKLVKIDPKEEVVEDEEMEDSNLEALSSNGDSQVKAEVEDGAEVDTLESTVEEVTTGPTIAAEVKAEPPEKKAKTKRDPNLKCPHCTIPRYFFIPQSLEDHIVKVHNRPFPCDLCESKFKTEKDLTYHKSRVHDVGPRVDVWTCGFCDEDFQQKRYMEDHLDKHPQAKPLNCQYCGRTFKRQESLKKAFQIYKGETVDPCNYCNRNLNLKDYLEHNRKLKE